MRPPPPPPHRGRTRKGAYSPRGRSRHLLGTPLLRTPSENPSQNPFFTVKSTASSLLRTLLRTLPQNPFENLLRTLILERCVAVRPLSLASRKRCDFYPAAHKIASDFSAISSAISAAIFLRFLWQNLRFSTLRFENAAIFLRLRFFGDAKPLRRAPYHSAT